MNTNLFCNISNFKFLEYKYRSTKFDIDFYATKLRKV